MQINMISPNFQHSSPLDDDPHFSDDASRLGYLQFNTLLFLIAPSRPLLSLPAGSISVPSAPSLLHAGWLIQASCST